VTGWNSSTNGIVYALAVQGNKLYAGGNFQLSGGQYKPYLCFINLATQTLNPYDIYVDNYVQSLAFKDGTLFVGGTFTGFLFAIDVANGFVRWRANLLGVSGATFVRSLSIYNDRLYAAYSPGPR